MQSKKFFSILILFAVTLTSGAFMNCSGKMGNPISFSSVDKSLNFGNSSGGNANGYEGKPDPGHYYRNIPDYRCGGELALYGEIEVQDQQAIARTIDQTTCTKTETTLQFSSLEYSGYNRATIGHVEGLFEKKETPPAPVTPTTRLVETWCRATNSGSAEGFDILIKVDGANQNASSEIFAGIPDNGGQVQWQSVAPFAVSRSLVGTELAYSGVDFRMSVDLSTLDTNPVKVPGQFQAKISGKDYSSPVSCRTAAQLDQKKQIPPLACPAGYIMVPALAGYAASDFCVMKYEGKLSGAKAVSVPAGLPQVPIDQPVAKTTCTAVGPNYQLMSNNQWQAMARNIEGVAVNWSGGSVGSGQLNAGNSDATPNGFLAASANDDDACFGTGETCSSTIWHQQRRTHVLSNGNVIWDVGGNAAEWMIESENVNHGPDSYISQLTNSSPWTGNPKDKYGPAGNYLSANTAPYAGLGWFWGWPGGAIARGGRRNLQGFSGIFMTDLNFSGGGSNIHVTFRCVFQP